MNNLAYVPTPKTLAIGLLAILFSVTVTPQCNGQTRPLAFDIGIYYVVTKTENVSARDIQTRKKSVVSVIRRVQERINFVILNKKNAIIFRTVFEMIIPMPNPPTLPYYDEIRQQCLPGNFINTDAVLREIKKQKSPRSAFVHLVLIDNAMAWNNYKKEGIFELILGETDMGKIPSYIAMADYVKGKYQPSAQENVLLHELGHAWLDMDHPNDEEQKIKCINIPVIMCSGGSESAQMLDQDYINRFQKFYSEQLQKTLPNAR